MTDFSPAVTKVGTGTAFKVIMLEPLSLEIRDQIA